MDGITPVQVATTLQSNAEKALALVANLRPKQGTNKELRLMLGDDEAMAHLGNYYAEKILAATDLALFDQDGQPQHQASSIQHLETALQHWKKYASVASSQYLPQKLGRLGDRVVDVTELTANAAKDIEIAKSWPKGSIKGNGEQSPKDNSFRP